MKKINYKKVIKNYKNKKIKWIKKNKIYKKKNNNWQMKLIK